MEPMALGSPVGSPSSPFKDSHIAGQGQSTAHSQYLPSYLMGDLATPSSGRPIQLSPKLSRTVSGTQLLSTTGNSPSSLFNHPSYSGTPQSQHSKGLSLKPMADKPGGPPVQRLFSQHLYSTPIPERGTPTPNTPQLSFGATPSTLHTPLTSQQAQNQRSLYRAGTTPAGLDTSYQQPSEDGQGLETWVTVFGFPPSAASFILTQMALCGTIIEHHLAPCGNWDHIRFASRLQARKALAKNGKVLGGSIMIGVVPCNDQSVLSEARKENLDRSNWNESETSMSGTSFLDKSSIRPLTQVYKASQAEYEVVQRGSTPQKSNSLVSKAMEYVFGW